MFFLGSKQKVLDDLKEKLIEMNPDVVDMRFEELPYCKVSNFDYQQIGAMVNEDNPDIIWVALGAPKQEFFMSLLKPHLNRGIMIAVGAAFNFVAGTDMKRAPQWMIDNHLEFVYRLGQEPKKQSKRCFDIVRTLPGLLYSEWRRSKTGKEPDNTDEKNQESERKNNQES